MTSLIQATDGNFYGTTGGGGASNERTIFQLTPGGVFTKLYDFCPQVGATNPDPGRLVQHTDGNFYGVTFYAENSTNCGEAGCGAIFKFTNGLAPFVKAVVLQGKVGSAVTISGNGSDEHNRWSRLRATLNMNLSRRCTFCVLAS